MTSKTRNFTKQEIQIIFFILVIPVIILGEFIRILHRVKPKRPIHDNNGIRQGYIRTVDGKTISVKYSKKYNKCVILVHGYLSSSKRSILKYSRNLNNNNYDFIALDFRNHGQSSLSLPISGGYYEKLDLESVIKWAKREWQETKILATSMGSYATIYALSDLNEKYLPDSVVLESFGVDIKLGTRDTLSLFYKLPPLLSSLITSYAHLRSPHMFVRNVRTDLQRISIPILIAHGDNDQIYSYKQIQPIIRKLLLREVKYVTIQSVGHSELWRKEEFQNAIIDFFND